MRGRYVVANNWKHSSLSCWSTRSLSVQAYCKNCHGRRFGPKGKPLDIRRVAALVCYNSHILPAIHHSLMFLSPYHFWILILIASILPLSPTSLSRQKAMVSPQERHSWIQKNLPPNLVLIRLLPQHPSRDALLRPPLRDPCRLRIAYSVLDRSPLVAILEGGVHQQLAICAPDATNRCMLQRLCWVQEWSIISCV